MTEADAGFNGVPAPPSTPVVSGFQILQLIDRDELGLRYRAREQSTGQMRTIRVVGRRLTHEQQDHLRNLWRTLLERPLDSFLATVVAHGTTADDAPWVATDGNMVGSLAERLSTGEPLDPPEVERLAGLAARALHALHENRLVHSGISPAAIVREGESWRLTDVGIAAIASPILPGAAGPTLGEVTAHAAPEVLAGEPPTPAADIFSLGATVAEALTGRPMIRWAPDETVDLLLQRHRTASPVLPPDVGSSAVLDAIRAACQADPERRPTATALRDLLGPLAMGPSVAGQDSIRVMDDDVQFTVYRPHAVKPERWYTMIAFAHKTDPAEADFGPPDPLQEVKRQAKAVLEEDFARYVTAVEDSASVVERGSELTFVPQMEGVEFNPPHSSFRWVEAVHREQFRFRATQDLDGRRARGRLSVFVGNLLVADVNLTMRVDSSDATDGRAADLEPQGARPYRKIFASYSHRDDAIVQHIGMLVRSLGDEFVRDCSHLRAGEVWSDQLEELIRKADVFQLFWSTNSITSPFVRKEWEYALSLGRPSFIRPCYWEEPLPARPEENLPPRDAATTALSAARVFDGAPVDDDRALVRGEAPSAAPTGHDVPRLPTGTRPAGPADRASGFSPDFDSGSERDGLAGAGVFPVEASSPDGSGAGRRGQCRGRLGVALRCRRADRAGRRPRRQGRVRPASTAGSG